MGLAAAAARPLRLELTPLRLRALRHGTWIGAALFGLSAVAAAATGHAGDDSHAYWAAWRHGVYFAGPGEHDAYLYSPAFAQLIRPLTLLPWPVFFFLWAAAATAIYAWLLAPLGRTWALPLLLMCLPEIVCGNVFPYFALVLVLGFRYPAAWAFPLLLKVTPAVGFVWFGVRREWRRFAIALGTAAAIAAVSYVAAPHLWTEWVRLLVHPDQFTDPARVTSGPLLHIPPRVVLFAGVPLSLGLTAYAARTNRPWLLPFAMVLASTVFWLNVFAVLTAIPRLAASSPGERSRRRAAWPIRRRRRTATATT
ncbi:MAG: glycosyltransferase 87 family protein [Gaiellaceae bacterium]